MMPYMRTILLRDLSLLLGSVKFIFRCRKKIIKHFKPLKGFVSMKTILSFESGCAEGSKDTSSKVFDGKENLLHVFKYLLRG